MMLTLIIASLLEMPSQDSGEQSGTHHHPGEASEAHVINSAKPMPRACSDAVATLGVQVQLPWHLVRPDAIGAEIDSHR
jgi:hypothetical protein